MASISNSIYGSTTNKGVGGLLSGLDTDDLVKQMTASTRNKINKQYQSKQKLLYRQEAYREISSKLVSFSNKYFSYASGSKTNILSPKFFESNTIKSSSNYVNITGNADNIKNFSINSITSVATAASFTSSKQVANLEFQSESITAKTSTLAGATFTIEFGDQSYNLAIDKEFGKGSTNVSLQEVADQLNKQLATIKGNEDNSKLKYSATGDKLEFVNGTAKLIAGSSVITENLNMKVGETAVGSNIVESNLTKDAQSILQSENSYITFDFNGVTKKINLSGMNVKKEDGVTPVYTYDAKGISEYLNSELEKAYGKNKVSVLCIGDKLSFATKRDDKGNPTINNDIFGISSISSELGNFTGLESGDSNRLNKTKSIVDLGIAGINKESAVEIGDGKKGFIINVNNTEIKIESTMSVTDVINKINSNAEAGVKVYYSNTTNTFSVKATETGTHKGVSIVDVEGKGNLAATLFGSSNDRIVTPGTDTVMEYTLNGVKSQITRSTANFTIDEINIELNEKAKDLGKDGTPVTFEVTNNSDEIVEKVKQFINEYNEIINLISTKTSEKPNRNYLPLTPEQQEEMKEEEIKNWNIEAKKGVLYGDNNMNSLLRSMKGAMTGITDVSSITLSNIGISSASMDTSGKLVLDEAKFKEKLIENPDEITKLFTSTSSKTGDDAKSGISLQLQSILRKNVGAYGTTGVLIDEAGMSNSMTSDRNFISEKIKDYDKKMEDLKDNLETERERYWKQFSALETSLNKLNSQSSWFTDMMGQ